MYTSLAKKEQPDRIFIAFDMHIDFMIIDQEIGTPPA